MDIKNKLINREDFNMKFADAPFTDEKLNPGWAEPTYDDFFTRMTEDPVLLEQSTVIPMTSLQHDLDYLTADIELQSQRDPSTGISTGLTSVETKPNMSRKQLLAVPLQAKALITDNFLEENIEKEGFMTKYLNILSEAMGPAFQRFGVFADKSVATVTGEGSGYKMTDGILAQLKAIAKDNTSDFNGYADVVYQNNIVQGIVDSILMYIEQDGDVNNANVVLPPQVYSRAMAEIGTNRETDWGDLVFQNGKTTTILGMPLVQDSILRETRNGYDTDKFTNGRPKANGSNIDKLTYGFIGQPNNLAWGLMRDFQTKNQYDIDYLGYKVAFLCKGDVKVLWDQDTLAIPFTRNTKTSS